MYIVFFFSLLAIFLTYLDSKRILKGTMKWGFAIITFISAIHYDYGNDYMAYYNMYKEIATTPFSWEILSNSMIHQDAGWVFLNYLFKPLGGFFTLVIFLSILQNIIIYKFIKREVASSNYTFAVFLYLMTTAFYLMSFTMLRQWFVVCVFLGCWTMIKERKWIAVILILYLCSYIHGSAKLLLPFAFWGFIPLKNGKVVSACLIGLFLLFYTANGLINSIFLLFNQSSEFELYFDRYGDTSNGLEIGIGFILQLLPLLVACWYLSKNNVTIEDKSLVLISSLGFIVMCFAFVIPMAGRISTYFTIFKIASIPIMYSTIRNRIIRYGLIGIVILLTTYDYIIFFSNPVWVAKYSTFKTIFSVI